MLLSCEVHMLVCDMCNTHSLLPLLLIFDFVEFHTDSTIQILLDYFTICAYLLQAARQAGKLWAKLVYFVLSPLLALAAVCTLFCLVATGTFAGSAAMTAGWVAWPLVKAWSQLKSAVGWLHPNKPSIHVILLLARKSATSPYRQEVIFACHTRMDAFAAKPTIQVLYVCTPYGSMPCFVAMHWVHACN